jgi:hypothetical protein
MVEKEVVGLVETESTKIRPGGTDGRGGRSSQRGRLRMFSQRWRVLEAEYLVKRGIMPIYTNRIQAEKYWKENIQFKEFQGNRKRWKLWTRK